jgi:hypothetical protein
MAESLPEPSELPGRVEFLYVGQADYDKYFFEL